MVAHSIVCDQPQGDSQDYMSKLKGSPTAPQKVSPLNLLGISVIRFGFATASFTLVIPSWPMVASWPSLLPKYRTASDKLYA